METALYNLAGKETGKVSLPGIFETKVSSSVLHEVVTGYMANQRAGTQSAKTRGEVSGGGKKPWREKGTGNARAGSNRSPLWRKGGVIFAPKPRSYYQYLPQSKRRMALEMALSEKAKNNDIMVVDNISVTEPKTKLMAKILKDLKLGKGTVIVLDKNDKNVRTASRNIQGIVVTDVRSLNTYEVLWAKKLVITSKALLEIGG
jgi:large subunit ribosomal protein L4